ncbi:MAG: hypothetical protein ABI682_14615 [Acidobacteriota bacterium]
MFAKFVLGAFLAGAVSAAGATPVSTAPPALEIHRALSGPAIDLGAGAALDAGGVVEVRWSGLPDSAGEVELLLSLDGGRTYSLRLTDELDPKGGSFSWEVPGLDSNRARLAIRIGIDGAEVIAAATAPFTISRDPSTARARLRWRSGEIWTASDGEADVPEREPGLGLSAAPESMTALDDSADAIESAPSGADLRAARYPAGSRSVFEASLPDSAFHLSRARPHSFPRRI